MKSIASAPGKIILFGEHFVVHGTKAILAAIDKRVTVTSTVTETRTLTGILKINSQLGTFEIPMYNKPEQVLSVEGYERCLSMIKSEFRPFVYLVGKMLDHVRLTSSVPLNFEYGGLEITIDSDIPIGVGLGSSSACCVAATASISRLFGRRLVSERMLEMSIEAEKTIFPNTSGADCTVCTYGGMIEYPSIKKIDNTFDLNLLIANSMIPHNTKNSVEKVSKFKQNNEERFSQLCALETKLIGEVIVSMKNNDATALGLKMSENQKYLEEIQISNDTLRDMISSLKEISLGTKITGAGDGGCVIALVKEKNLSQVSVLLGKNKECFSAKIDTKGVEWNEL